MPRNSSASIVQTHSPDLSQERPTLYEVGSMLELPLQRRLEFDAARTSFHLRAPSGAVELTVRITADGPVLSFSGATLECTDSKSLSIDVAQLSIRAGDIRLESTGGLEQVIAGDSVTHCEGRYRIEAGGVAVTSHRDTMVLDSSNDLAVSGRRVLINC